MSDMQMNFGLAPKSPEPTLEDVCMRAIANMDSANLSVEARVNAIATLTELATAHDLDRSQEFLGLLDEARGKSPAFDIAYELYSSQLALRGEEYLLAEKHCERGRGLALKFHREAEVACFCIVRGTTEYRMGNYAAARTHFEEAVVAARRAGSLPLEARGAMNLGLVLKNSGDLRGAERLLRFSLSVANEGSDSANSARCEVNLANVLIRRGAWNEACELALAAAQKFDSQSLPSFVDTARLTQMRAVRLLGHSQEAHKSLIELLDHARQSGDPRSVILALEFIGDCELDMGDGLAAREHYREALLLARRHGRATDLVVETLRGLGTSELACGEALTARGLVEESTEIARQQGDAFELAMSLLALGRILSTLNQTEAARNSLNEARSHASSVGADHLTAECSAQFATILLAAESSSNQQQSSSTHGPEIRSQVPGFITVDSKVLRTLANLRKLAPRGLNILIHGESGTGKELIAQAVHTESGRRGPFVPVNCSAFPGDLIEGELFGHARGAYTGADRERVGLFEYANKGTLFLDEIGDMPIKAQARLLRALESGEVRRLGENNARVVDVRVVAATHRDLMTMVGAGEFRLDLYYRLAGYVVELPPIRDRVEDAKLLIDHFLVRFAKEQGKSITLTPDLRQQLAGHSWPGNVREIRLVMDRLVSLSEDGAVLRTLPFALEGEPRPRSLPELLEAEEKRRILDALQSHNWNKQRAATTLGTNRTTLIGKMKRMGIAARKP